MVARALSERGIPFVLVNQRDLARGAVDCHVRGGRLHGTIETSTSRIALEDIGAIYARTASVSALPERHHSDSQTVERLERNCETMLFFLNRTDATVVNRPEAMHPNGSKPYQIQLIRAFGFSVPDTLVTNDPVAVLAFRSRVGTVIYKSISGERSTVRRLASDDDDRLATIERVPVQFQAYVDGTDVRVHVVGDRVFASAVFHRSTDYRSPEDGTPAVVRAVDVPNELATACVEMTHAMGLSISGIDLRVDRAGRVVCFEVNPSPGFSYYERMTGQPIALAIADYLAAGASRRR